MQPAETHQVSVCICTFKRVELLRQLIEGLQNQRTDGLFQYSIVVADNDPAQSAKELVARLSASSSIPLKYCHEPEPNIAMARNKALQNATGDFIAFIDDDEFPIEEWLYKLFTTCDATCADGVLGPVKPKFETDPPKWVTKGRFFERPTFPTGDRMNWEGARTGNVLFRKSVLNSVGIPFRPEFATAGEDVDFFRRLMERGHTFLWCNEAAVYEVVPASRCTRSYLLKRALLRGSNFNKHPTHRLKNGMKSMIAVPCYTIVLPFLALFGEHLFLRYLIKLLDHCSRLLGYLGLRTATRRQT